MAVFSFTIAIRLRLLLGAECNHSGRHRHKQAVSVPPGVNYKAEYDYLRNDSNDSNEDMHGRASRSKFVNISSKSKCGETVEGSPMTNDKKKKGTVRSRRGVLRGMMGPETPASMTTCVALAATREDEKIVGKVLVCILTTTRSRSLMLDPLKHD